MENHLLEYIKIKDFKCFKDFEAKGFKRVNLIGGKNNVGKTAFMEACYVNVYSNNIDNIFRSLASISLHRNIIEYARNEISKRTKESEFENTKKYFTSSNINNIRFEIIYGKGIKSYEFKINGDLLKVNVKQFSEGNSISKNNIRFIMNTTVPNILLINVFISLQKKKKEKELSVFLNNFDNNIEEFIVLGNTPSCKVKDINDYRDINEFGDGLKHFIFIICSLYACEDGYLFIDEIDNGIHYTQLDRLWEIILTISKEQNVQVFATTHSKECIDSYARVSKKLEDEDITYIKISKLKDGSLNAGVRDYEMIQYSIDDDHEVR